MIKFLFCKLPYVEKLRRQWNVNHTCSNKNSQMTNGCRKWRNRLKTENFFALAEYLEQQTDYRRQKRKIRKSRRGPSWRMNQPYFLTFPYHTNRNHATELLTVAYVISERHWKSTFDFTEIISNYGLKRGTV